MRGFVWASLMVILGCGGESREGSAAVNDAVAPRHETEIHERDSAGIRIVESVRPVWAPGRGWRLDDEPSLVIGTEDGPPEYQFYRIGGAHRTPEGSLIVTNAGSSQIRVYDVGGRHVRAMGQRGGGPGEFHQFSGMSLWVGSNGTIHVEDGANDRINAFTIDGALVRTYRLQATEQFPRAFPLAMLSNSEWLAWAPRGGGTLSGAPGSVIESEWAYARYRADGTWVAEVLRAAGRPRLVHQSGSLTHYPYIPLTADPLVAAAGGGFAIWIGPHPEIALRDGAGVVRTLIRWHPTRRRAVSEVWDRFARDDVERITQERDRILYRNLYALSLPLPRDVPVIARLLADANGNLWTEHYRLPWDTVPAWDIFNSEGHWLGELMVPRGLRLLEIGSDHVVARHRDEDGIERVQVYRLVKGP
ncbi:MAG: 6-bladed beta-propeller [Gemmatimonadales bacterium]